MRRTNVFVYCLFVCCHALAVCVYLSPQVTFDIYIHALFSRVPLYIHTYIHTQFLLVIQFMLYLIYICQYVTCMYTKLSLLSVIHADQGSVKI